MSNENLLQYSQNSFFMGAIHNFMQGLPQDCHSEDPQFKIKKLKKKPSKCHYEWK